MRLADGTLWPMPITLDADKQFVESIKSGDEIALRDAEGLLLAILRIGDIWQPDKVREAQAVFGTTEDEHPGYCLSLSSGKRLLYWRQVDGNFLAASLRFFTSTFYTGRITRNISNSAAGKKLWHFKLAIPCIVRTRN